LPYLASSCGHRLSTAELQLNRLGIARNTEFTTAFGLAPILLGGTKMIALIHERMARAMAHQTTLRLLEPPMQLEPIHELLWSPHAENDPGHQWLRSRLVARAAEMDTDTQPDQSSTRIELDSQRLFLDDGEFDRQAALVES